MIRLRSRACILSRVEFNDANAIDGENIHEEIGELLMTKLVEKFYKRIDSHSDQAFRSMFSRTDFDQRVQSLTDFLCQRFGGPSYYSDQKGHPSLIRRHVHFDVNTSSAEKWLDCMEGSLEEMDAIRDETKEKMMNYFRFTAYFLVAAQEGQALMSEMADYDVVKETIAREAASLL